MGTKNTTRVQAQEVKVNRGQRFRGIFQMEIKVAQLIFYSYLLLAPIALPLLTYLLTLLLRQM